uniref:G_PROTEIN_RECEP_F1_2 domain-containing protein n=1 Tax=Brugia timori TaxID=42155 RepID=A0A0R3QR62_9BILA
LQSNSSVVGLYLPVTCLQDKLQVGNVLSFALDVFLAFSRIRTFQTIMNKSNGQKKVITCIFGWRVIAIAWVIIAHSLILIQVCLIHLLVVGGLFIKKGFPIVFDGIQTLLVFGIEQIVSYILDFSTLFIIECPFINIDNALWKRLKSHDAQGMGVEKTVQKKMNH